MKMQLVIGSGGLAKQAIQDLKLKNSSSIEDLVFFDNTETAPEKFFGYRVINRFEEIDEPFAFTICIGTPKWREYFYLELAKIGGHPMTVISENAIVHMPHHQYPVGSLVLATAIIEADVEMGVGCLVNTGASIHHDCKIGSHCEIMPGARILGEAQIGDRCRIGTNAVILPKVKLCNDVVIGAGAVVTKDIDLPGTYVGVPARQVR